MGRHRAHAAPALSRRPARRYREQPDLHDADRAGAAGHGHACGVLGLSDVRAVPDRAREVLPAKPRAREHRQAGADGAHAVRGEGEPAGDRRLRGSRRHRARADADDRPHAECHLARAQAAADRAARARLLGRRHARAAAARREPVAHVVRDFGVARARRSDAGRTRAVAQHDRVRRACGGDGRAFSLRAEHAGALAACTGRRRIRRHRIRAREAGARLVREASADLFGRCTARLPPCRSSWCGSTSAG